MPPSEITSTDGSAFPWILDHLLSYPGAYEIPLRTMYTNNILAQSNRPGTPALSNGSSANSSPTSPDSQEFSEHFHSSHRHSIRHGATDHFKSCLMDQISYLPSQPFSLPPSFITSFVRRSFTEDLCLVDFTQALTALDYLKDIENRRKRELSAALLRLGIDKESFQRDSGDFSKKFSEVAEWFLSMDDKERRVEALYTQLYIGLRRWTLINEMRLEPFNKANCIAMLNTLYPPSTPTPPTPQLTPSILASQRNAFFRYIQAVEKNGKSVLTNLENQSRRTQDENGWPVVREIVDKYLRAANAIIEECFAITVDIFKHDIIEERNNARKTDSGVSFASGDRPSTSNSMTRPSTEKRVSSEKNLSKNLNKPLPASPVPSDVCQKKAGSTLERIAREIRRIKSRSGENKEMSISAPMPPVRSLKKMKSTSAIGRSGSSKGGSLGSRHSRGGSGDRMGLYEIDDTQRERLISEARALREKERESRFQRQPGTGGKRVEWEDVTKENRR